MIDNLYFIYGPERLIREGYVRRLTKGTQTVKKDTLTSEDAYWLSSDSILFDSRKALLIVREDLGADTEMMDILKGFGAFPEPLIICSGSAKENTKLFRFLKSEARVLSAGILSKKEFEEYVKKRIQKYGMRITAENYEYLIERLCYGESDTDLLEVDRRLWQLSFFDEVTEEKISAFVTADPKQNVFDLCSLIGSPDFIRRGSTLTDDRIPVLSTFLWALRISLKEKIFGKDSGVSPWQRERLSGVLAADRETILEAMRVVQNGIDEIKDGAPERAAYLSALARLGSMFEKTVSAE